MSYFTPILKIEARRRLGSRPGIDDVTQETLLRVFRQLRLKGGLEHAERLGAFVHSVCKIVLLEVPRKDERYVSYDGFDAFDPPGATIDMDRGLVDRDNMRLVEKVLRDLPASDVEILRMLYLWDMDRDEICRRMGVKRSYLPVLAYRAR